VTLAVWVVPGAADDSVVGVADGRLKVRLRAPAREGAANRALVRFLARHLAVAPSAVRLLRGEGGRRKLLEIEGLDEAGARQRLDLP
jgi:hypothetical protein